MADVGIGPARKRFHPPGVNLRLLLSIGLGAACCAQTDEVPSERIERVAVAPAKTSLVLGSVTLTMSDFVHREDVFESRYSADVFPFSLFDEAGMLKVPVSADALQALVTDGTLDFEGSAVRSDGKVRRLAGRAVSADAESGRLKVRITVVAGIELVFNTTYRFVRDGRQRPAEAAGPDDGEK